MSANTIFIYICTPVPSDFWEAIWREHERRFFEASAKR